MTTTKKKKPTNAEPKSTAIVLHEISLSPRQQDLIMQETPRDLIKSKPGRGGKRVAYVEGGYVIAQLNRTFSPVGWEYEVVEWGETARKNEKNSEGEVWVKGKLTIIDHKNGFRVSKIQFGQHPIHTGVPMGDALKAAGTDALKKCASMLGIALDVYWGTLDTEEAKPQAKMTPAEAFERAKIMLSSIKDSNSLIAYDEKLKDSKTFNKVQQEELHKLISQLVDKLDNKTQ